MTLLEQEGWTKCGPFQSYSLYDSVNLRNELTRISGMQNNAEWIKGNQVLSRKNNTARPTRQNDALVRVRLSRAQSWLKIAENMWLYTYTAHPSTPTTPHWPSSQTESGAGWSPKSHSGFSALGLHQEEQADMQSPCQIASPKCCSTAESHHARIRNG